MPTLPAQAGTWITAALLGLVLLRLPWLVRDTRRGSLPPTRLLLPTLILLEGVGLFLPGAGTWFLRLRLGVALALEGLLLVLAIRAFRQSRPGTWPEDRLAGAFAAFLPPRVAWLMALELVMLGSAVAFLAGGFRREPPPGFSHHREASLRAFLPALPLLIPGDVLFLHALAPRLAPWLRWVLHGSTVYAVLWLLGFYATLKARPHLIQAGRLTLHLGLVKSVTLPLDHVLAVAPLPAFDDDWARHAHLKGVGRLVAKGAPTLELTLAAPVRVRGLLGLGRPTQRLVVSVDDPTAFAAALKAP